MLECRYYDLCCFTDDSCNGEPECPKRGHCQFYSPMPDVKALKGLADKFEKGAKAAREHKWNNERSGVMGRALADAYEANARRIREALGGVE